MNLKNVIILSKRIKTKYLIKPVRTPRYTKHRDNTRHFIPQEATFYSQEWRLSQTKRRPFVTVSLSVHSVAERYTRHASPTESKLKGLKKLTFLGVLTDVQVNKTFYPHLFWLFIRFS